MKPGPRLERRLDARLAQRPRSARGWLGLWAVLVLLGFSYPLALTTRLLLLAAAAYAFARGFAIGGAVILALALTYVLQVPLIVGIAWGERDLRRAD